MHQEPVPEFRLLCVPLKLFKRIHKQRFTQNDQLSQLSKLHCRFHNRTAYGIRGLALLITDEGLFSEGIPQKAGMCAPRPVLSLLVVTIVAHCMHLHHHMAIRFSDLPSMANEASAESIRMQNLYYKNF